MQDPRKNFQADCSTSYFLKYLKFSSANISNGALGFFVLLIKWSKGESNIATTFNLLPNSGNLVINSLILRLQKGHWVNL